MFRTRPPFAAFLLLSTPAMAAEIEFVKTHIDKAFRAEGVAVADVDGDGKKDILAGALWYRAPDWKPHEIAQVKEFQPEKGYSESFCCFADDLNGDDRPDLIVVGFPGAPVRVYENPGPDKLGAHWKEHQAFPSATNESPAYTDIDGDDRKEMVCGFEPDEKMAWFSPGASIGDPWTCHPLSGPKAKGAQKYYHGLGIGDVNKDGRLDVVTPEGWYEAPADRKAPEWVFRSASLGPASAHMHVLDLDGDGDQDALGSSAHQYGIWWYEQTVDGEGKTVWTQHEIERSYSQTHALLVADLNGDGHPDFVTGRRWMAHMGGDPGEKERHPAVLNWYELQPREGKPHWVKHAIDDDSGVGTQFEIADVNGDGFLDIAISNKKGVFLFEQSRKAKAPN